MLPISGPVPAGADWAYEFAWDGIRALAHVEPHGVRLLSGAARDIGSSYPELQVLAERAAGHRLVLDGKVVALDGYGRPNFGPLRRRMHLHRPSVGSRDRVPVAYYLVDLLRIDDTAVLRLPYRQRRALLAELGLQGGPIVLPPAFLDAEGADVLRTASQYGLSGVVAKRADSSYHPGRRSKSWVQTALRPVQQVVIGGWVAGRNQHRDTVGSLLVGVPTEAGPRFVGQVASGLTDSSRAELFDRLTEVERRASPFVDEPPHDGREPHWVAPVLFGEVAYRDWTPHGRLSYPAWRGLRPGTHPAAVRGPVVLPTPRRAPDEEPRAELQDALRAARTEVTLLRGQFAPHFLYNALNVMIALVRTDPERSRRLLAEFAHFTRYALGPARTSTLGDELENIQRYLRIERARLGERLRHEITVATELLAVPLPMLALQLLVMSAVRDGVEPHLGGGTVSVQAAVRGGRCVVTVHDDGDGAEPATESPRTESANLAAVRDRLAEYPGVELTVHRVAGEGTTCHLRLPVAATTG